MHCPNQQMADQLNLKPIVAALAAIFVLRFLVIFAFDLGVDEAHYMLYARYPEASYFDHPPLVGWTHYLFNLIFGETLLSARLPGYLAGMAASYFLYRYLLRSFDTAAALMAVVAMNASFILNASFFALIPETFLLLLIYPIIVVVERLEKSSAAIDYVLLGVLLGLAGLAKYSAILLVPPIILYFFIKKIPGRLFHPYMLLTIVVGLIFITPVLYWNIANDFISFAYQRDHVTGGGAELEKFARSLAAQLAFSPLLFIIAVWGFVLTVREIVAQGERRFLFPGQVGAVFSLFFMYSSFFTVALPHWSSLFYVLFIPLGIVLLVKTHPRFIKYSVVISVVLVLVVFFELLFKIIPFKDYRTPYRDILGWTSITARAAEIVRSDSAVNKAVAVARWTKGSRAMFYYPDDHPVIVIDKRFDQFDLWQSPNLQDYDVLLIETRYRRFDKSLFDCDALEFVEEMIPDNRGAKVNSVKYTWCRGYRYKPGHEQ